MLKEMTEAEMLIKAEAGLPKIKKVMENLIDAYAEMYAFNVKYRSRRIEKKSS